MGSTNLFLAAVLMTYLLSFVFHVRGFASREETVYTRWAGRFLETGFIFHTFLILTQYFSVSGEARAFLPVNSVGEECSFFVWSLVFVYVVLVRRLKLESFGLALMPVLVLFLIPALFPHPSFHFPPEHTRSAYFLVHILSAFFGYAGFALAFIAGVLYLSQEWVLKRRRSSVIYHKLPPLEDVEAFIFHAIRWGLLLLGVAIVSGALWSKDVFDTYFLKEAKSFASLLTWAVYAVLVYLHEVAMTKGKRIVKLSLGSFALVLITFIGTSLLQSGLHGGAW